MNIWATGLPLLPESGCADPLRRKEIGSMYSIPFSVFWLVSRSRMRVSESGPAPLGPLFDTAE